MARKKKDKQPKDQNQEQQDQNQQHQSSQAQSQGQQGQVQPASFVVNLKGAQVGRKRKRTLTDQDIQVDRSVISKGLTDLMVSLGINVDQKKVDELLDSPMFWNLLAQGIIYPQVSKLTTSGEAIQRMPEYRRLATLVALEKYMRLADLLKKGQFPPAPQVQQAGGQVQLSQPIEIPTVIDVLASASKLGNPKSLDELLKRLSEGAKTSNIPPEMETLLIYAGSILPEGELLVPVVLFPPWKRIGDTNYTGEDLLLQFKKDLPLPIRMNAMPLVNLGTLGVAEDWSRVYLSEEMSYSERLHNARRLLTSLAEALNKFSEKMMADFVAHDFIKGIIDSVKNILRHKLETGKLGSLIGRDLPKPQELEKDLTPLVAELAKFGVNQKGMKAYVDNLVKIYSGLDIFDKREFIKNLITTLITSLEVAIKKYSWITGIDEDRIRQAVEEELGIKIGSSREMLKSIKDYKKLMKEKEEQQKQQQQQKTGKATPTPGWIYTFGPWPNPLTNPYRTVAQP